MTAPRYKDADGQFVTYSDLGLGDGTRLPRSAPSDVTGVPLFTGANPGFVSDPALGTDGAAPPAIAGTGIRGWLRGIYERLGGTLAVSATSLPLPNGASSSVLQVTGNTAIANVAAAAGAPTDPAWDGAAASATLPAILKAIWARLASSLSVVVAPFAPLRPQTYTLTAGPAATTAPVQLPALGGATSYRVRNPAASASPITWTLASNGTTPPVIPTAYTTAGTGGVVGDKTIDPGGVETFQLSAAQQTALAGGNLYWSAITPANGSGTLSITFGNGG